MRRDFTVAALTLALAASAGGLRAAAAPLLDFEALRGATAVGGSVTILDLDRGAWHFSDPLDAKRGSLPASTFKVPNLLIALAEGSATKTERMAWDGNIRGFKGRPVQVWNRDLDAREAFVASAIWYFVELSRRTDRELYRKRLKALGYGNGELGESDPDFWNQGRFAVTPIEQVEFLAALARDELPFSKADQAFLRECMFLRLEDGAALYRKSGWAVAEGRDSGWLVGWLDCPEGRFAFATRLEAPSDTLPPDFSEARLRISLGALKLVREATVGAGEVRAGR